VRIISKTNLGCITKVYYQKKPYILKERSYSELGRGKSLLHELKIFEKLSQSCKYIVKLEGYFRKDRSVCMLLHEAKHGDLHSVIQRRKAKQLPFSESEILSIMKGISEALAEIHRKQIIHRDLKTLNVFVDEGGVVKLGDFGISREVSNETVYVQTYSLGTPLYLSAEVIENRPYNEKIDLWALGVILYELLTCGDYPFEGNSLKELMHKICGGSFHLPSSVSRQYSDGLINLLHLLLRKDFSRRPSATEVLEILNSIGRDRDVDIVEPLLNAEVDKKPREQKKKVKVRKNPILPVESITPHASDYHPKSPIPRDPRSNEFAISHQKQFFLRNGKDALPQKEWTGKQKTIHARVSGKDVNRGRSSPVEQFYVRPSAVDIHRGGPDPSQVRVLEKAQQRASLSRGASSNDLHASASPSKGNLAQQMMRPSSSRRNDRWEARRRQMMQMQHQAERDVHVNARATNSDKAKGSPRQPSSGEDKQFYRKSIHDKKSLAYEPVRRAAPNQNAGKKYNILLGDFE